MYPCILPLYILVYLLVCLYTLVLTSVSVYFCIFITVSVHSCILTSVPVFSCISHSSMVTWNRRTETWSCANSAPDPPVSSSPPTCWPEGSTCSRSRLSLTMIYLPTGKTIFIGESVQYARYCIGTTSYTPTAWNQICNWNWSKYEFGPFVRCLSLLHTGLVEVADLDERALPSTLWQLMMSAQWRTLSSSTTPRSMRCQWMLPT